MERVKVEDPWDHVKTENDSSADSQGHYQEEDAIQGDVSSKDNPPSILSADSAVQRAETSADTSDDCSSLEEVSVGSVERPEHGKPEVETSSGESDDQEDDESGSSTYDWDVQVYRCVKCGMAFSKQDHLVRHLKIHTFNCKTCGAEFSSDVELLEHEDTHREAAIRKESYSCKDCNITFGTDYELSQHYGKHIYACSFCSKTFTTSGALLIHEKDHREENLECDACGRQFQRSYNLAVHKQKFCPSAGNQSSETAQEKLKKQDKNLFDMLQVKKEIDDNVEKNDKSVNSVEDEDDKDDVIACDDGGDAASPSKPRSGYFNCSKCPKAFTNGKDYMKHCLSHGLAKNVLKGQAQSPKEPTTVHSNSTARDELFHCPQCQSSFKSESQLISHLKKHKYSCDICRKTFANRNKKKHHMSLHNAEKVFECKKCGRQFARNRDIKQHLQRRHNLSKVDTSKYRILSPQEVANDTSSNVDCLQAADLNSSVMKEEKTCPNKGITQHPSKSVISEKFVCRICERSFPNQNHLDFHSLQHKHTCDICLETFSSRIKMISHRHLHTATKIFACKRCSRKFVKKCFLFRHIKSRHGVTPHHKYYRAIANIPDVGSQDKSTVNQTPNYEERTAQHADLQSSTVAGKQMLLRRKSGRFKRTTCNMVCSSEVELARHQLEHKYTCEHCGETFSSLKKAARHRSLRHTASKIYRCQKCNEEFLYKRYLILHLQLIHSLAPDPSHYRVIGRPSKTETDPKMSSPTEKPNHIDKKSTAESEERKELQSKVVKEKVSRSVKGSAQLLTELKCTECELDFSCQADLDRHLSRHKYPCEYCEKTFTSLKKLRSHISLHTASEVFECKDCGKQYAKRHHLQQHLKNGLCSCKSVDHSTLPTGTDVDLTLDDEEEEVDDWKPPSSESWSQRYRRNLVESPERDAFRSRKRKFASISNRTLYIKGEENATTSKSEGHKCLNCSRSFTRKGDMIRHASKKHGEYKNQGDQETSGVLFYCKRCPQSYSSKNGLSRHIQQSHARKQPGKSASIQIQDASSSAVKFHCRKCQKKFGRQSDYTRHMKTWHPHVYEQQKRHTEATSPPKKSKLDKDPSQCASSSGQRGSDYNKRAKESPVKRSQMKSKDDDLCCAECGKQYRDSAELKRHEDTHVFMCKFCSRFFTTQKSLQEHKKVHISVSALQCKGCNIRFETEEQLKLHQRIDKCSEPKSRSDVASSPKQPPKKTKEVYSCELCSEKFSSSAELEEHQEYHTLNEFSETQKEDWDETIVSQRSLTVHRKKELRQELFICRFCDQTFSSLELVHRHERSHTAAM